jgi:hypothetical protein
LKPDHPNNPKNRAVRFFGGGFKPASQRRSVLDVVLFAEAFNTTRSVHELLFAGKKRMTRRANFNGEVFDR